MVENSFHSITILFSSLLDKWHGAGENSLSMNVSGEQ